MKLALIAACLLQCGCAFNLGYVNPQPGSTHDQLMLDMLLCKDEAVRAIDTAGRIARDAALHATIVGSPLAVHLDRTNEREVFKTCMNAKGYEVVRNY